MATNQTTVGEDLYTALDQFFQLFPDLRANPFFVTGESYAGKYVPAAAYTIHLRNADAPAGKHINLKGVAIGDGAFDPPTQFTGFGPLLFNIGLADTRAAKVYDEYDANLTRLLAKDDLVRPAGAGTVALASAANRPSQGPSSNPPPPYEYSQCSPRRHHTRPRSVPSARLMR